MLLGPLQEDASTYTEFGKGPIKHSCRSRCNFQVRQGHEGTSFWKDLGPCRWKQHPHTPEQLYSRRAGIFIKLIHFLLDLFGVVGSRGQLEDILPIIRGNYSPWSMVAQSCGLGGHLGYGQLTLDMDNWLFLHLVWSARQMIHGQGPSTLFQSDVTLKWLCIKMYEPFLRWWLTLLFSFST